MSCPAEPSVIAAPQCFQTSACALPFSAGSAPGFITLNVGSSPAFRFRLTPVQPGAAAGSLPLFLGSSLCGACGFVDERNLRAVLASQGLSGAFSSVRCESPVGGGFAFEVVFNDTEQSTTLFHCGHSYKLTLFVDTSCGRFSYACLHDVCT